MRVSTVGVLLLIFAATFLSCTAKVGYVNEGIEHFPATNPQSIEVHADRQLDRQVIEIGYVAAHNTQNADGDFLKDALRKEAASMGADAIVGFRLWGYTAEGIAVKFK